ncbi:MAG TPA: carbon-nitrogen hydrolase [Methanomassiliicoccales archaeon]|jgi:agmatine deiminase
MKQTVTLGLVQMEMRPEPSKNLDRAVEMIGEAKRQGAEVVCLPELFTSTYFAQYSNPNKEEIEGVPLEMIPGDTAERLSECARKNQVIVIGGSIYERAPTGLFNTCLTFDQDGVLLGKYRKVHIPHDENFYEQHYFTPGDLGFKVYGTEKGRIGTLICYDQWFPEAARINALMGADMVFYPTAIGTVRGVEQAEGDWQQAWENVMRGHAISNGMVVVAVNRAGNEDHMDFWGGSFVCDAFGRTLVRADAEEQVLTATIDLEHGRNVREGWRFFHNRRPDQYGKIMELPGTRPGSGSV